MQIQGKERESIIKNPSTQWSYTEMEVRQKATSINQSKSIY